MKRSKILALGLALALTAGLLAGCTGGSGSQSPSPTPSQTVTPTPTPSETAPAEKQTVNLAVLKGPSGVGAAKLLADSDAGETANDYAYSILADMGYIVSCESDMHGAISMALLSCAALGKNPPFFGEFTVRHPEDKNVELLWHCGPFAYSLKKPGTIAREENQRQWFQVKDGKFTICRFDQDDGHYQLLNGTLESADGPYTFGTYLWARFNNLTKWERKLIDGPYIHHMAEVEGDYTWELREFCRLIPHLDSDTVD